MNLFERFLLFFSDYRKLRDEKIQLGDEVLALRGQLEAERARFDELMAKFVARETAVTDKMLELRYTPRQPEPAREVPVEIMDAKRWVQHKKATFANQLRDRAQQLANGSK